MSVFDSITGEPSHSPAEGPGAIFTAKVHDALSTSDPDNVMFCSAAQADEVEAAYAQHNAALSPAEIRAQVDDAYETGGTTDDAIIDADYAKLHEIPYWDLVNKYGFTTGQASAFTQFQAMGDQVKGQKQMDALFEKVRNPENK